MEYFDERTKSKFVPHVIEPSLGVDRLFLAIMVSAYHEDEVCVGTGKWTIPFGAMSPDRSCHCFFDN